MSEFRIHHDVNELLSLLRVRGSGEGAEVYIDLLQKNRAPYLTTTASALGAKVKIAEFSRTPEDFLNKYDELKSKNTRHLDSLVCLLSKLTEDKETLQYLQQNAKERAELAASAAASNSGSSSLTFSVPSTTSKMTVQELEELRKQLGTVTTGSSSQQPLELIRKALREKQNKKNSGQPIPSFPSWVYERPALIGDFLSGSSLSTDTTVPIGTLPLAAQESAVVEDLLYVLIGVDGRYITAQPLVGRETRTFLVDPNLDMSVKELVTRILPVAASYSIISRFVEEKSSFEYGQVNHALAAAMRTLVKEYMILITQLEHLQRQGLLSLQKLWFYIQPTMRTMEILASLATSIDKGESMGGSTLSLLHDKTFNYTGDSQAQELCLYLTKAASVPYFEILEKWIYRGIINDPYRYPEESCSFFFWVSFVVLLGGEIDLMPHDLITQLLRVLAIETKQEKAIINADPTELSLSGLEAFSFDYIVKWPLSLIINRKALTRYQMLFRHMFYCKHVERQLCNVWISSKTAKQCSLHSSKWFAGAFTLRQRMLNFVQNIQYYMMFEVMEPTWHILEKNLKLASNIDDVLSHHTSFLDNCLKDCMLTNPELLKIFSKLMSVCVMFTNCMQRFSHSMKLDKEMDRLTVEHGTMRGPPTKQERVEESAKKQLANKFLAEQADSLHVSSGFEATINKFDSNFSAHLLDLLDKLSIYSTNECEHSMINIIYRLDFNGFYTERLEHMSAERSQKTVLQVAPPPRVAVPTQ
ncbi:gamma-tubulin complex component 2 [Notechis scutatus]|uniref:Gamma-tubulin complex component n=1 Tax=Notechis scutatus TaxID=8663 RepID=A0A6J1UFF4_9SAUR|nr:gamma-tubulin complex component 2 [Notechis scutatus]